MLNSIRMDRGWSPGHRGSNVQILAPCTPSKNLKNMIFGPHKSQNKSSKFRFQLSRSDRTVSISRGSTALVLRDSRRPSHEHFANNRRAARWSHIIRYSSVEQVCLLTKIQETYFVTTERMIRVGSRGSPFSLVWLYHATMTCLVRRDSITPRWPF